MRFAGSPQNPTFLQVGLAFEIEVATGKNQNRRRGMMLFQTAMYMSLIYSAVQGTHYWRCI
jgi:hypothetical protein